MLYFRLCCVYGIELLGTAVNLDAYGARTLNPIRAGLYFLALKGNSLVSPPPTAMTCYSSITIARSAKAAAIRHGGWEEGSTNEFIEAT